MSLCCCNASLSTACVCGTFETPETPDEGQCAAYRVKRDCEAPILPDIVPIAYNPNAIPVFTVE